MKKIYSLTVLILIIASFASCSIMHNIERNHDFTKKLLNKLYRKNGNAFYLNSCYFTSSRVWTYYEGRIDIYMLYNGKTGWRKTYEDGGIMQYVNSSLNLSNDLYGRCPLTLDGDMFGYIIDIDNEIHEYSLDIDCLKQGKYESGFLNKLVNDINKYKMWEWKVKSVSDTSDGNK